mgnify:CR=1 FL=1
MNSESENLALNFSKSLFWRYRDYKSSSDWDTVIDLKVKLSVLSITELLSNFS